MDEEKLKEKIKPFFKNDSWSLSHTINAAEWMKKLLKKETGNPKILITAIYLHDIGYNLKEGYSLDERIARKKFHGEEGSILAKNILEEIGDYSEEEITEICHLVKVHDELDNIKTKNETMMIEADSISGLDPSVEGSRFTKEDLKRYIDNFKKRRVPLFKTKTGKEYMNKLLVEFENKFLNE
ncbi:MAG: HD domain-containing protein [Nanoarchaeota archaeon]